MDGSSALRATPPTRTIGCLIMNIHNVNIKSYVFDSPRSINSCATLTLLWLILLKYARMFISMPTFIIVCSFIRGTIRVFFSWLDIAINPFTFLGKVLGYFPFTSVSCIIHKKVSSARWKSVSLVLVFLFKLLMCNLWSIKTFVQVRTYLGSRTLF